MVMSMKKILRKERETFSIMTNMKEILRDFNALADARKKSSLLVKLAFGFCALTVSAVLFFSYSLLSSMGNKILVVNENGEYLKQKAMDTDKLYEELLRAHCSSTAYYLNSFDRLSWQENQAHALFLVSKPDATAIFAKYRADRAYGDALELGAVYRNKFEKIISLSVENGQYHVIFSSVLTIINGSDTKEVRIISEGTAIRVRPRFPENISGFFFRTYNQQYENL